MTTLIKLKQTILRANGYIKDYNDRFHKMHRQNFVLYGDDVSPPVRFVKMVASALGVNLKYQEVDLFKGENLTEHYKKINPLKKVPALKINDDEVLIDSHAIALFLCEEHESQSLYPKNNSLARSKINELLFYNSTHLFPVDSAIFSEYFAGTLSVREENKLKWSNALNFIEDKLYNHHWLAGDEMTIADLCCMATISSVQIIVPLEERYGKIKQWLMKLNKCPFYEINTAGLEKLKNHMNRHCEKY